MSEPRGLAFLGEQYLLRLSLEIIIGRIDVLDSWVISDLPSVLVLLVACFVAVRIRVGVVMRKQSDKHY